MRKQTLLTLSFILVIFLLTLASIPHPALAQENFHLTINEVDSVSFPEVTAYLTVVDVTGLPIEGLVKENFTISEDAHPALILSLQAVVDTTHPISIVLAIDVSGSMTAQSTNENGEITTALENAKEAAISFVDSLAPDDLVSLVSFASEAVEMTPLTTDKDTVKEEIQKLEAVGGTALNDAMMVSVDLLKRIPAGRKAAIILADGDDSHSTFGFQEAIDEASRWSIPIYPIGFGNILEHRLEQIAQLTGGYLQIQPDSTALNTAFQNVLGVLRYQYVLTFESGLAADNTEHSLAIGLDYMGAYIEDTYSFIAHTREIRVRLDGISEGSEMRGKEKLHAIVEPSGFTRFVTIAVDGNNLTTLIDEPYEYIWDSTATTEGEHLLTVTAEDTAGNVGTLELTIMVRPPIVMEWKSPSEGETISGLSTLSVDVDSDQVVSRVEFYIDDEIIDEVGTPPFELEWDFSDIEPGDHVLKAIVYDDTNNTLEEAVTVNIALGGNSWIIALAILVLVGGSIIIISIVNRRRRKIRLETKKKLGTVSAGTAQAILREMEGLERGRVWNLGVEEVSIGRKRSENDIPVTGQRASRRHAIIQQINGQFVLTDLNSENPSIINGVPSGGQHTLTPGDLIRIGNSELQFEAGAEEQQINHD